jgi:16S rRNA processing protein RimM
VVPSDGAPPPAGLLEVGRVERAHGLRGDVVVRLTSNVDERLARGAVLDTDRGARLHVEAARRHQLRWIVRFAGIADRESAEDLRGTVLLGEPLDEPGALWAHELIGRQVVDQSGAHRGRVEALQDNPASDLLVLDSGHLVPLTFVTEVGLDDGPVRVEVPDGLFEL